MYTCNHLRFFQLKAWWVPPTHPPTHMPTFPGDMGYNNILTILLKQGAELEMKDIQGWTALFHCTSAGHQQMVKFLLDSGANANVR